MENDNNIFNGIIDEVNMIRTLNKIKSEEKVFEVFYLCSKPDGKKSLALKGMKTSEISVIGIEHCLNVYHFAVTSCLTGISGTRSNRTTQKQANINIAIDNIGFDAINKLYTEYSKLYVCVAAISVNNTKNNEDTSEHKATTKWILGGFTDIQVISSSAVILISAKCNYYSYVGITENSQGENGGTIAYTISNKNAIKS